MDDVAPQDDSGGPGQLQAGTGPRTRRWWTATAVLTAIAVVALLVVLASGGSDTDGPPTRPDGASADAAPQPDDSAPDDSAPDDSAPNDLAAGIVESDADSGTDGGECAQAFEAAAEVARDDMEENLEEMSATFSACDSFEEFATVEQSFPDALYGVDPALYARNQCRSDSSISGTPVCRTLP